MSCPSHASAYVHVLRLGGGVATVGAAGGAGAVTVGAGAASAPTPPPGGVTVGDAPNTPGERKGMSSGTGAWRGRPLPAVQSEPTPHELPQLSVTRTSKKPARMVPSHGSLNAHGGGGRDGIDGRVGDGTCVTAGSDGGDSGGVCVTVVLGAVLGVGVGDGDGDDGDGDDGDDAAVAGLSAQSTRTAHVAPQPSVRSPPAGALIGSPEHLSSKVHVGRPDWAAADTTTAAASAAVRATRMAMIGGEGAEGRLPGHSQRYLLSDGAPIPAVYFAALDGLGGAGLRTLSISPNWTASGAER